MPERQLKTVRASIERAPSKGGYRYSLDRDRKPADQRPTAEQQLREAAQGLRLLDREQRGQRDQSGPERAPAPAQNWPVEPEPRTAEVGGAPEPVSPFGGSPDQLGPRQNEAGVPVPEPIFGNHNQ